MLEVQQRLRNSGNECRIADGTLACSELFGRGPGGSRLRENLLK
jgi:hypothetical protein